jgi:hypothetical protein
MPPAAQGQHKHVFVSEVVQHFSLLSAFQVSGCLFACECIREDNLQNSQNNQFGSVQLGPSAGGIFQPLSCPITLQG